MKDLEQIVGLQTDKPLKRAFMPYGGIKMAGSGGFYLWLAQSIRRLSKNLLPITIKLTIRQYLTRILPK